MLDLTRLSRTIAHALRHEPWLYELELDAEGWVDVNLLLNALRDERREWRDLSRDDLAAMIAASAKQRYKLQGERIRAFYGHSTPEPLKRLPAEPPAILYHGTSPAAWPSIQAEGLRPMNRQFVHLSTDVETALQVDRRKAAFPLLLRIDAASAHAQGVTFSHGNQRVWLADAIPARFVGLLENG